ncbi:hypothetical protein ACVXG7_06220 [Enterobacter hormaechei]
MYYTGKNPLSKIGYRAKTWWCRKGINSAVCIKRCCAITIRKLAADPPGAGRDGEKHRIGSRRDCLVPAPTLEEMREARRQNRNTRPALTKHTPIAHQRSNGVAGTKKNVKRKTG